MFEWVETDYAQFSKIGLVVTFLLDRNGKKGSLFRLRCERSDTPDQQKIIRIKRGTLHTAKVSSSSEMVFARDLDDMAGMAVYFKLTPLLELRTILSSKAPKRLEYRVTPQSQEWFNPYPYFISGFGAASNNGLSWWWLVDDLENSDRLS